jgi:hypothetical protein
VKAHDNWSICWSAMKEDRLMGERPTKLTRHLDALTQEAVRQSLENIGEALFIRYGQCGHEPTEERGWLIEWPPSPDHQPRWWHPKHGWTVDASRAIRYARREDAEAAIESGRLVGGAFASEHSWLTPCPRDPA